MNEAKSYYDPAMIAKLEELTSASKPRNESQNANSPPYDPGMIRELMKASSRRSATPRNQAPKPDYPGYDF